MLVLNISRVEALALVADIVLLTVPLRPQLPWEYIGGFPLLYMQITFLLHGRLFDS